MTTRVLKQALHSLGLHRLRAALSALGIVCAVVSFVAMMGLSEGARQETLAQIEQLGLRNIVVRAAPLTEAQFRNARKAGSAGLAWGDTERIRRGIDGVTQVAAVREVAASVSEPSRAAAPAVLAVTPNLGALQRLEVASGRFISAEDVERRNFVCVVGHEVSRRLLADGQPGGTVRIGNSLCKVVGILARFERRAAKNSPIAVRDFDHAILLPLGAEGALVADAGAVTEIIAEMRTEAEVIPRVPAVRRALEVSHRKVDDFRIVAPQELLKQARQSRRNFDILAGTLAAVCLVVGGIGIMNTMLASVVERTREIGIRRAVGATRSHIAAQFLAEALLLTGAGAVVGLALGVAGVLAVSAAAGWPVAIGPLALALPTAAAIAAGLFFGLYPALCAARLDPIAALRHD